MAKVNLDLDFDGKTRFKDWWEPNVKNNFQTVQNTLNGNIDTENIKDSDMIYNYIDENMPEWAREPVQWCMDKGVVAGTGDGLGLNNVKLWVCVVVYRAAKVVAKLVNVKALCQ